MHEELSIITRTYDLLLWSHGHIDGFPRGVRYSLGGRLENRLFDLLDALIEAKFSREKSDLLRRAALQIEQLRFLFRIAKDLRLIALGSHHFAAESLEQIGRELGGWRRHAGQGP